MCSICGIGFLKDNALKGREDEVKSCFNNLMINCEVRGTDASGIMSSMKNSDIIVVKNNVRATQLVSKDYYIKEMDNSFANGVDSIWSIMGHCRAKTKGSQLYNVNNHPIVRKKVVGVHNGHISNDDAIFSTHGLKRNGEVDSEALFALIESTAEKTDTIHEAIMASTKLSVGAFACGMVHVNHPYIMWMFRRNNPCDISVFRDVGMVVFASDSRFIKNAFGDRFGRSERMELSPNSGVSIDLQRNKFFEFSV